MSSSKKTRHPDGSKNGVDAKFATKNNLRPHNGRDLRPETVAD